MVEHRERHVSPHRVGQTIAARTERILELLQVDRYAESFPHTLSLGHRKLVTVARGLMSAAQATTSR